MPPGCAAFSADRTCMRAAACASTATLCPAAWLPGVDAGNPPPVSSAGACCCPSKSAVPGLAGASGTLPSTSTLCSVPLTASSAAAGCLAAAWSNRPAKLLPAAPLRLLACCSRLRRMVAILQHQQMHCSSAIHGLPCPPADAPLTTTLPLTCQPPPWHLSGWCSTPHAAGRHAPRPLYRGMRRLHRQMQQCPG